MAKMDWICENCFTQNTQEDTVCPVCGLKAPGGTVGARHEKKTQPPEPVSLTDLEEEKAYADALFHEGSAEGIRPSADIKRYDQCEQAPVRLITRNSTWRWMAVPWIVVILMTVSFSVFGMPFWKLFQNQPRTLTDISRLGRNSLRLFHMMGHGIGFSERISPGHTAATIMYAIRSYTGIGQASIQDVIIGLFATFGGARVLVSAVWTVRLFIRCLWSVGRQQRKLTKLAGLSFPLLTGEAFLLNILMLMLDLCRVRGDGQIAEVLRLAASQWGMQMVGVVIILQALMMIDAFSPEWRSGSIYRKRMFRRDLLMGLICLLIFLMLVFISAASPV